MKYNEGAHGLCGCDICMGWFVQYVKNAEGKPVMLCIGDLKMYPPPPKPEKPDPGVIVHG